MYIVMLLPKNPRIFEFYETVKQLSESFREKSSLFNIRYQCLKLVKNDKKQFAEARQYCQLEFENLKLQTMTEDQFKCLIVLCALQSPRDAEIIYRLLSKIEQGPDSILQMLTAKSQQLKYLNIFLPFKQPSSSLAPTSVHTITRTRSMSLYKSQDSTPRKPPTACWQCGDWQFVHFCTFKQPTIQIKVIQFEDEASQTPFSPFRF
ncbi:unnamed protein product [Schistocephalus solidus]|uniref:Uncharacterized protein n=1 Tax=Schistocephalus solidus TaxID=70667 RepID=A0A183SIU6_SCHSO|nr:unnamed protein product [Schistocephalus solidus]